MGRVNLDKVKARKTFYQTNFHFVVKSLFISVIINGVLLAGIALFYFTRPPRQFYATSGVTSPILLRALDAPNMSSKPLLKPDPKIVAPATKSLDIE